VRHGVVIVGSSVGGVRAARALRAEGYRGPVTLVGEEPWPPCDRPPLSKQVLSGAWAPDRAVLLTERDAAADDIKLRPGTRALALDAGTRQVLLADDGVLPYDDLVIATGASPRPSPWRPESGVYQLRTLADSLALKERFAEGGPVVMIGGGFIGAETAAAARLAGCEVTIVDPVRIPMQRAAGPLVGALLAELHHRHGTATRFGVGVRAVSGRSGDLTVTLDDESALRAGTVIVGIGAVPNDQWLRDSGLVIDDGVACDAHLAAIGTAFNNTGAGAETSTGHVFALGDVARWPHPELAVPVRSEHWTNAADQARCVAHNIAQPGALEAYQPSDYVWSDQYDWKVQIAGLRACAVAEWVVGTPEAQRPQVAVLHADATGRLCAVVCLNWPRAFVRCRRLLDERAPAASARELLGEL
jgi:phthalate 3,4-dioxygenase ferredoxin reductase subunit